MWKLMNLVFGFDYIQWRNCAGQGIARVRVDGMNRAWYFRHKNISVIDFIDDPKRVVWLTCAPEKYVLTKKPIR